MSSRDNILKNIRSNIPKSTIELPNTDIKHMQYKDKNKKFAASLTSVGGNAVWLKDQSIDEFIKSNYKDLKVIASTCKAVTCNTLNQEDITDQHELKDVDLAVINGHFGVAENGAVWVNEKNIRHRALYFIARQLLIVVKKEDIVDTMHEAYKRVDFEKNGYGVFISGPSKTADIEQSLVIGAHGPTDACVLFV
jgi:L-lactate dehydrogenase complex protein LldG